MRGNKPVFLDYASTCPVVKYPQRLYRDVLGEGYFLNPNANYSYKEKHLLAETENRVKKAIGAKSGKVIFGGTSSQLIENLVMAVRLKTDMDDRTNYRFYYSRYEHDSVERFNNWLSSYFYVDNLKDIVQEAKRCKKENITPFIFWQAVQNITGEIFPVVDIGNTCLDNNAFYICDATATVGHTQIPDNIDKWCSAFVIDGHKLGTELGIGCVWISHELDKWLNGFKLHGTPNLAGALALTQAVEDACDKVVLDKKDYHWTGLADVMYRTLEKANINYVMVPDRLVAYTCAINAIRLPGFNADALQQYLASKRIYIGVGHSSCADNKDFRILQYGYGLSEKEASEVIRISFGENSNETDILALAQGVKEFKEKFV